MHLQWFPDVSWLPRDWIHSLPTSIMIQGLNSVDLSPCVVGTVLADYKHGQAIWDQNPYGL